MLHTKKVTIGKDDEARVYSINHYPAMKGVKLSARLAKLLGVPLAQIFLAKQKEVSDVLPGAMAALFARMEEEEVSGLITDLLSTTTFEGELVPKIFDNHFMGRIGSVLQLSIEVVKFQFEDFFSVAISAGLKEMAENGQIRRKKSNG